MLFNVSVRKSSASPFGFPPFLLTESFNKPPSSLWSALPHGALHPRPDGALGSLRVSDVVPVQLGVGDLVHGLRLETRSVFRAGHHHGQRAPVGLELHHVELLLVGQVLMCFLKGGQRSERDLAL